MTADLRLLHALAPVGWRARSVDELAAMLSAPRPWDVRHAIVGERLVALATVTDGSPRTAWVGRALAGSTDGDCSAATAREDGVGEAAAGEAIITIRHLAATKGWRLLDGEGPGLELAVPGEHDLPPIRVQSCPHLRVERPLPLLPLRDPAPVVRYAVMHAILVLNGVVRAARIALRDPATLTVAAEFVLPAEASDEDEVECALEGVRHASRHAAAVLDCVRNPAVASVYATAHGLPPYGRELHD